MASKFDFLLLILGLVRISGSTDLNYGADPDSTSCVEVLIREFGPQVNYRFEIIRLISTCSKDYRNSTIRQKCETEAAPGSVLEDIFLFTLALDMDTKSLMYYNVYCAICNGQKEFYQFPPHLHYQLDETSANISESTMGLENNKKYYPISEHTLVLGNLRTNDQNDQLISFNEPGLRYKFKPYKVLIVPKRSKKVHIEPMQPFRPYRLPFCPGSPRRNFECEQNSSKIDDCYYNDEEYSNIFNSRITIEQLNRQPSRPTNVSFCPEKYIDSGGESSSCKYEDENGHSCWWNKFLTKGVDYVEGEDGEIFFVDNYTLINISRDEYSLQTGLKNVLYLCGVEHSKGHENQYCMEIINNIQSLLRRFSIFCVIVYLLIKGHRRLLADLMEKITYSYYTTLLLMYIREEISDGRVTKSCFLEYSVYRYLLQSYAFWIIIATCYLCIIIRTPGAELAMNQDVCKRRKLYLTMCLLGWGLPAIFTYIFYLFEAIPSCPIIQGYISLKTCKASDAPDAYFRFILITIGIICTIVLVQFMAACYYYQFGKSKMSGEIGCSDWKTRMVFFFKIAYSIGLYLMLLVASAVDRDGPAHGILLHLWSFHGTLIFFLYSFKVTVLKNMFAERESPEGAAGADRSIEE